MAHVTLERWAPEHLALLSEANTAEMTQYIGGPEPDDDIVRRHERYLRLNAEGGAWMYAIVAVSYTHLTLPTN